MAIHSAAIISRPRRQEVGCVVLPLIEWLEKRGVEVFYDHETASCISLNGRERPREELPDLANLLIVLGGDGTLLASARAAIGHPAVLLPVNLGGLGFLTSVTLDEMYPILEDILEGRHRISERVLLQTEVIRGGSRAALHYALNDAVLNKGALARMVDLELHIDGGFVTNYKADGLIVSTPTGSTAYSLAAGGPIIYPLVEAFVITPICPHTLTNRPLVIPNSAQIEIGFHSDEEPVYLTLDGQVGVQLAHDDRVAITKAETKLRIVRPSKKNYFEILRSKLKWGER